MSTNVHPDIIADVFGNHVESTPMTSAQTDRLRALCDQTGQSFDASMTEPEAAKLLAELEAKAA